MKHVLTAWVFGMMAAQAALSTGCGHRDDLAIGRDGLVAVDVVTPAEASPGLVNAARDLLSAFAALTGAGVTPEPVQGAVSQAPRHTVVLAVVDAHADATLGDQGYRIEVGGMPGKAGLKVTARTDVGAMYGLYAIAADLGVQYLDPEETFFPSNPGATLPRHYTGQAVTPRFSLRGFHEHTQHPIPMSDFLLKAPYGPYLPYVEHYVKWLARNRQNVMGWHMLKTIDEQTWIPYMQEIVAFAHGYGVKVGTFTGFVDQQQNAFKIIREDRMDPGTGGVMSDEKQIAATMDWFLQAPFDYIGLQIGSSEFTKPGDQQTIDRLDYTAAYLRDHHPTTRLFTWIHTTCSLKDDQGGYFYHLPLQSDPDVGAFVHTTMFYTLTDPAPVYDCENFTQQRDFMDQADGQRTMVFFPETAWWLGFDSNMPLTLPITGYSRALDITENVNGYDVEGHVTFTTGREWGFYQYDHFLTKVTFDAGLSWDAYLDQMAPLYGSNGAALAQAIKEYTRLQVEHFYRENPEIIFYLTGELTQDEIGEMAGILARRPKLSFKKVMAYDDETFNAWKTRDLDMLARMREQYQAVMDTVSPDTEGTVQQRKLYNELYQVMHVYVRRIEHAMALYEGVAEVRRWYKAVEEAGEAGDPPDSLRQETLAAATTKLDAARAITAEVRGIFTAMEASYRYPVDILCREKESPTSYQFGYLYHTSTAHFWQRRDDQLEQLIDAVYDTLPDAWEHEPVALFLTDKDHTSLTEPHNALAGKVIGSFMPQMLFGFGDFNAQNGSVDLVVGQDYNVNLLPDAQTELTVPGHVDQGVFEGAAELYSIVVKDSAGFEMGQLAVADPVFRLNVTTEGDRVTSLADGELIGDIYANALVQMVVSVGGIDAEGAEALVKSVFDLDDEQAMPERLPITFSFTFFSPTR